MSPPSVPAQKPTTGASRRSDPGEMRQAGRTADRATKTSNVTPRVNSSPRVETTARNWVPTTVPMIPVTISDAWRRSAAMTPGRRTTWTPSIRMFGITSTATAVRTSVAKASSGVAISG